MEEMLKDNNAWEKVFKDLYEEFKVAPYMSDFCYLYYETECHNMVTVIETRRNMLNLSRVRLAEDICTERTIIRFEREGANPSVELIRRLFDRMGLCAEYRRARVITNDVEALMLSIEVVKCLNDKDSRLGEERLRVLEGLLDKRISFNKQEIKRWKKLFELFDDRMDRAEFYAKSKVILECSVPIKSIFSEENKFYTREEWTYLFDLAFETSGEVAESCELQIEDLCLEKNGFEINSANIYKITLLSGGLEGYLNKVGRYEDSLKLGTRMIELFLRNRRMNALPNNLYSNLWNLQQLSGSAVDRKRIVRILEMCIILSELIHRSKWSNYYAERLCRLEMIN